MGPSQTQSPPGWSQKQQSAPPTPRETGTLSALGYVVRTHCKAGGYVGNYPALLQ